MECPNCGTYNPEDREKCWRCDEPLPTPEPEEERNPQKRAQTWLYIAIAIFFIITLLQMCGVRLPIGPQMPKQPSGHLLSPQLVACWSCMLWAV
jgi:predicted nucleic acid-binding Zn ribbon protein